ncbi:Zinc finger MYM-type protein 1 [Orchesella cincta]|uniref:Zinc finger MYM-type protein 1 n=1 Tax=Orchesella cincta TaxID=48709 RepID=A0A1D2MBM4_ORCCI|nr:Zinc finger MYM-type protein 1 [Orchesella cincta]
MNEPHQPAEHGETETPPPQSNNKRCFNFQFGWYKKHPWIHYDPSLKRIVCHVCANAKFKGLFSPQAKIEAAFTTIGYCNWKNGNENLKKHENSLLHKEAVSKLLMTKEMPISNKFVSATVKQQEEARTALKAIFTTIMYLGKQGLAFRGTESDTGNFMSLLKLRANDIDNLKTWLDSSRSKTYTSAEIQNSILESVAHSVLRSILPIIQSAKFFSVIVDETTDISVQEQVSLSVRVVSDSLEVREYFLGLYNTASTTGESLTAILLDTLQRFNLPLDNLRGQCYDGASNMSGKFRGVQSRSKLSLQDTISRNAFFRDVLSYVHEIGIILKGSPSRVAKYNELAGKNDPAILRPHPLCPTRWTVRVRSINGVIFGYAALLELLEELSESGDQIASKAGGLRGQLEKGEFYLGLVMARSLFSAAESLSKILQSPTASVSGGIEAATITLKRLISLKSDANFQLLWSSMMEKIDKLSLETPSLPRVRRKPKKLEGTDNTRRFDCPNDRLRVMYHEAIDFMCEEIGRRFDQSGLRLYENLENALLRPFPTNSVALEGCVPPRKMSLRTPLISSDPYRRTPTIPPHREFPTTDTPSMVAEIDAPPPKKYSLPKMTTPVCKVHPTEHLKFKIPK